MTPENFKNLPIDDKVDYKLVVDSYEFAPIPKAIGKWLFLKLSAFKKTKFKVDAASNRYMRVER